MRRLAAVGNRRRKSWGGRGANGAAAARRSLRDWWSGCGDQEGGRTGHAVRERVDAVAAASPRQAEQDHGCLVLSVTQPKASSIYTAAKRLAKLARRLKGAVEALLEKPGSPAIDGTAAGEQDCGDDGLREAIGQEHDDMSPQTKGVIGS